METKQVEIDGIRFEKIVSSKEIDVVCTRLAGEINADYKGKEIVFLVVLNGAFMFAADLLRKIDGICEVHFVKLSSYEGMQSSGKLIQSIGLPRDLEGKDVIVIEDIVDSGFTMGELIKELQRRRVKSCEICAFTFKPCNFKGKYTVKYAGLPIDNDFVVGYGMDLNHKGRNLGELFQKTEK